MMPFFKFLGIAILVVVQLIFCAIAVAHLLWGLIQTSGHIRAVGWRTFTGMSGMLRVQLRRPGGKTTIFFLPLTILAIACALIVWSINEKSIWVIPLALSFMIIFIAVMVKTLTRPYALFLASSSDDHVWLQKAIKKSLTPLRTVSLLEARDDTEGGPVDVAIGADILRTRVGEDWHASVHELAILSDLVIMDLRYLNDNIRHEVGYTLQLSMVGKTIFICDEDGSCPALTGSHVSTADLRGRIFKVAQLPDEMLRRNPFFHVN
jgi:hypothetical protein